MVSSNSRLLFQIIALDETGETVTGPTDEDGESFKAAGEAALAKISITDVSKTDLADSCGLAMYACAAKIVDCAESKLVKGTDGKITPLTSACNCFVRGYTESIPIPGKTDVQFDCTSTCVESILSQVQGYVSDTNKEGGSALNCDAEMKKLDDAEIGNKNGYIASETDNDPLEVMPVDDEKVVRAANALRISINSQRQKNCPAKHLYDEAGRIVYAKRGIVSDGTGQYRLEVVFGNDVVHGRVAHLPKRKQSIDPTATAALDDPDNLDGRFQLMSITPEPCADGIPEQLAVSESGESMLACFFIRSRMIWF